MEHQKQEKQNDDQLDNSIQVLSKDDLQKELQQRKFMNEYRWICISKPQYLYNCGINSVTSCWNYLYSTLGNGDQLPISQEEAMYINGYGKNAFWNQSFNPGNQVLMKWFQNLCQVRGVKGKCGFFWKKNGLGKTNFSDQEALERIKRALKDKNIALVYHIDNHYVVPVGYDQSPVNHEHTLTKKLSELQPDQISTDLIIGDQALLPAQPSFFVVNFKVVAMDLGMQYPYYYSVKQDEIKIKPQNKKEFYEGGNEYKGNRHCMIGFYKIPDSQQQNQNQQQNLNVQNNKNCGIQ